VSTAARPRPGEHPDWCAQGHRCGLGEHRAQPVRLDLAHRGAIVLTRVLAADGHQHVEIRTRISLADDRPRAHLAHILLELDAHLRRLIGVR
jgi:hypothetical protein